MIGLSLGNLVSDGHARNLMRTNLLLTPLLNFAREDLGQDQLFLPVLGRLLTLRMYDGRPFKIGLWPGSLTYFLMALILDSNTSEAICDLFTLACVTGFDRQ